MPDIKVEDSSISLKIPTFRSKIQKFPLRCVGCPKAAAAAALRGVQGALEAARGYGRRAGGGPNSHAHLGSALDVLGLEEIQTIPKDLWDVCFVFLSK